VQHNFFQIAEFAEGSRSVKIAVKAGLQYWECCKHAMPFRKNWRASLFGEYTSIKLITGLHFSDGEKPARLLVF
jgi:hypothetical protein